MARALRSSMALLVASWVSLLAGCDLIAGLAASHVHGGPIAEEIERAVGAKPDVISSSSESTLVVTVQFSEVPAVPVPSLEAIARTAIVHEYKKDPNVLTISFVYQNFGERAPR